MAPPGDHPAFPPGTGFSYLAEGAANIVYRISVNPGTPPPSQIEEYEDGEPMPTEVERVPYWHEHYDNKLLRVRKNLPTTVPVEVAHDKWLKLIAPLFGEDQLVYQSLVEIRPANVIEQLNHELRGWEIYEYPTKGSLRSHDIRPTKRKGIYLADDDYGLLVTDMTPRGTSETVIEIKPKWLAQSPSAPKDSKRCRQCARIARENAKRTRAGEPLLKYFCPLDLLAKNPRDLAEVSRILVSPPTPTAYTIQRMSQWLADNTLLTRLRDYQRLFDQVGPLEADVEDEDFLCAMTLRDCSVYLRFPSDDEDTELEARIGDLDLKSKDKKQYWHDTEKQLIDEGWYQGFENAADSQPLTCKLSPGRYGPGSGAR